MSFLNATLVFGTLAAVIPIVLHLVAHREPRKVVFPSIAFLAKRMETNRSKLKVRRWWLLAMRIAAMVALALALARPAIHQSMSLTWLTIGLIVALGVVLFVMASVAVSRGQSKNVSMGLAGGALASIIAAAIWGTYTYASGPAVSLESNQPISLAIVIDNSPTSAWRDAGDSEAMGQGAEGGRIKRMQSAAVEIVAKLPRTSRVAVIDRSPAPAAFSLDIGGAISKLEQVEPRQVVAPLATRIDAAARLLRTSDLENRQILLITDFSVATWNQAFAEAGLIDVLGQDAPIGLSIFDSGEMRGSNRSLSIPRLADETPAGGVTIPISSTLSYAELGSDSTGNVDRIKGADDQGRSGATRSVAVELELFSNEPSLPVVRDGVVVYPSLRSVDRTSATLAPGQSSELLMTIPSLSPGTHHGQIRLTGDDAMPFDDVRYFSLSVLPASRVLIVGDDAVESRVIEQVIAGESGEEYQVERIGTVDMDAADLSDYGVVMILDPSDQLLGRNSLVEYAGDGGGVMVVLGPRAGNASVASPLAGQLVRRWLIPDEGTFMQVTQARSPVTQPVSKDTPWSDFRVTQYWQVDPAPGDQTLMSFAGTDHPALIRRSVTALASNTEAPTDEESGAAASGRVLVLTTPIPALAKSTQSWNGLFGTDPWPAWLLVRQSVEYLSGRTDRGAMSLVGTPHTVRWDEEIGTSDSGPAATRLQLFAPGGEPPAPIEVAADATRAVVGESPRSGTYWIRGADVGLGFSANLPDNAIQTNRLDLAELDTLFGPSGYTLTTDPTQIDLSGGQGTARLSLQSPAMLLALILFLLEQILGNRFYRPRS